MKNLGLILFLAVMLYCIQNVFAQKTDDLAYKKDKLRLIVCSDIGGTDPDDRQSMMHFLLYTDVFDVEGIVSSPWGPGRVEHILGVIDSYEKDYEKLKTWSDYPHPDSLRKVSKQGAIKEAPDSGYTVETEGSKLIVDAARRDDPRPLYIAVWGAIDDVAQALHDAPEIADKIRVYWIAGPNRHRQSDNFIHKSSVYMEKNFKKLWWIQADQTYRGMFNGGNMSGDLGNGSFPKQHVVGHGALGAFWRTIRLQAIKMGDTPSILFFLNNDVNDPTKEGWGGAFVRYENGTNWWRDNPDNSVKSGKYNGAKTVNKWREDFLRHWQNRMDWCVTANPNPKPTAVQKYTNSNKKLLVNFSYGNGILNISGLNLCGKLSRGEIFNLSGASVSKFILSPDDGNHKVNLYNVQPGIYIIKVKGPQTNILKTFITVP